MIQTGNKVKLVRPVDNAINHLKNKIGEVMSIQDTNYPLWVNFGGGVGFAELQESEVDVVE